MPKLKPSRMAEMEQIVISNICAQGEICGAKTDLEKARRLGMPSSTFSERRKNPRGLRLEEIIQASLVFKCSMAWLVTDHRGEFKEDA